MKRNIATSLIKITVLVLFISVTAVPVFAIGEFSLGINAGFTYAPNNIDDMITRYNTAMKAYQQANPGTGVSQISVPYAPVLGLNVRYQFNFFLIRLGWHYTTTSAAKEGSITPNGGVKNKLEISTFQHSLPATIGLIMPLKKRTYFYLGAGGTFHMAYFNMEQSNPDQGALPFNMNTDVGLSDNTRDRYYREFVGYHLILGAEVPIGARFTLTAEWIHQEGRSFPTDNDGKNNAGLSTSDPRRAINVRGDILLFGINYYVAM